MTYSELAALIATMTPEQQAQDVTIFLSGISEFYPLAADYPAVQSSAHDVLDEGHWYLVI